MISYTLLFLGCLETDCSLSICLIVLPIKCQIQDFFIFNMSIYEMSHAPSATNSPLFTVYIIETQAEVAFS